MYVFMFVYMCVCMYVHVYMYLSTHYSSLPPLWDPASANRRMAEGTLRARRLPSSNGEVHIYVYVCVYACEYEYMCVRTPNYLIPLHVRVHSNMHICLPTHTCT